MNDFIELENDLKKLRPLQPSARILARIEEAMKEPENRKIIQPNRFRLNWVALGFGLAAARCLVVAGASKDRAYRRTSFANRQNFSCSFNISKADVV